MKFIGIIIYLFLFMACVPIGSDPIVLRDSTTGGDLDHSCSSNDEDRVIFPALQGECDHVTSPSKFHHVTRQVINGEVCCVMEIYIDHGNGEITPIGN